MNAESPITAEETTIDLPLVKITKEEVLGALLVHMENEEPFKDSLFKLQTWIRNFADEQVKPLRACDMFTEEEVESIKQKCSVISPMTLTLFLHYVQMEQFLKKSDAEKEAFLLQRMPNRFNFRFEGNRANRNALGQEDELGEEEEELEDKRGISFDEFLKMFGAEIRKEKK